MHQRTQRIVGRVLFCLFCLLPTVAVTAWALTVNRPGYREAWETALSDRFGLNVTVDRVRQTRPGTIVFEKVRISDPETAERIARVRLVEMVEEENVRALVFSQPQVDSGGFVKLWDSLHKQLTSFSHRTSTELHWLAAELTCAGDGGASTLTDVHGQIGTVPAGRAATLKFRIAGQDMPEPAQVRLLRTKHNGEPFTRVEFHTGGNDLPCSLLAPYLAWLEQVGTECRFNGSCSAALRRSGWEGEVVGQLTELDLNRLVCDVFPHKLSGPGDVTLRKLRFQGDRIHSADGTFSAGPGVIGRSLIYAASDSQLAQETESANRLADTFVEFDQLAFTFKIGQSGLTVLGACDSDTAGAILTQRDRALLVQPRKLPVPAVALVRTLAPDSNLQVPASRETDLLLRVLPLPQLQTRIGGRQRAPHLRFGGAVDDEVLR